MSAPTNTQEITQFYQNILQRAPDPAGLAGWLAAVDSNALTLLQVEQAIANSSEAQTYVVPVVELYTVLGRAPDQAGLEAWAGGLHGESLAQEAAGFLSSAEGKAIYGTGAGAGAGDANLAFVTTLYQEALGRAPDAAGEQAWTNALASGALTPAQVMASIVQSSEAHVRDASAIQNFLLAAGQGTADYGGPLGVVGVGQTVTLTTGVDNVNLTGNNNVVNGTANGPMGLFGQEQTTFSAGDTIASAGTSTGNVLNLVDLNTFGHWTALSDPTISVSGIQTLNLVSGEGVAVNTASTPEGFSGLTALNVKDAGGTDATAGANTAVAVTDTVQNGATELVNGGSSASVTTTSTSGGGSIIIGNTTSPTGAITVIENTNFPGSATAGSVSTTGGTSVTVTENLGTSDTTGGATVFGGAVNVVGTSTTAAVTVNQTPAATASSGPPAVEGVVDGNVTISDANAGSTTKAGTITGVTLNSYGHAVITDNALANLSLGGTGGGVSVDDELTAPTVTALALAVNSLTDTVGLTDVRNELKTINITTGGSSASRLGAIADNGLTTLTVAGTQNLTITNPLAASLSSVTVSGGAGLGIALGTSTTFTSTSTGTDVVTIGAPATTTITGNGTANEEIVWNGVAAPAGPTYMGSISGFKVLGIGGNVAGNQTFDLTKLAGFSALDVQANANAGTIQLANVTPGTPLSIDGAFSPTLVYQVSGTAGPTDSVAVTLGAASNNAGFAVNALTLEDSSLNGIGTVALTSNASTKAALNTIGVLNDASLTSLSVAGTGGLEIVGQLTSNAASLTVSGSSTGTGGINFDAGILDTKLATLTLSGTDNISSGTGISDGTSGITVSGSGDNANVNLALLGATASGKTDSITLGNGTNSVTDQAATAGSTVNVVVGTGPNTVTVGGYATNNITFGAHTAATVDAVIAAGATSATVSPEAMIAGINNNGADTIQFMSDPAATGPINLFTATQINTFGSNPTTLSQAVAGVLSAAGGNLAQHAIGEFQFQGNTYFLEQANTAGSVFGSGDGLIGLTGSHTFTVATNATAGVLHLLG